MNITWQPITTVHDVEAIIERSKTVPCFILKHSTRCPISSMAMRRLESSWDLADTQVETYYLDLIRYRPVSNFIADEFGVRHESPQALFIKNGVCVHNASHLDINVADVKKAA
ncbi:bacillithiol system redox-active protein YtxJ [Neolewinella antarctica]|uniref:Bacillithiol system protein YtxJ n=1 Tax=Neolewinella antarctica TaxID=442734 RepID=A0ABX0XAI4_9BACT|nr:bacillithiol system redox-active protein YtxJ [Neolewinella antarctica]NJC26232.1 bacillithiol system protein YtxJ [Neolewinella antarctica]